MDAAAWGLLGTLIGAITSICTTLLASATASKIQSKKQEDDRIERAREFQRENLLKLQEELHDALRLTSRAKFEDLKHYQKTGEWGRAPLPDELNERLRLTRRRVALLTERVADSAFRSDVKVLMAISADVMLSTSPKEAETHELALFDRTNPLMERLGSLLRSYY